MLLLRQSLLLLLLHDVSAAATVASVVGVAVAATAAATAASAAVSVVVANAARLCYETRRFRHRAPRPIRTVGLNLINRLGGVTVASSVSASNS